MPPVNLSAWERVGPMLAARRAQISPRYANRQAFADDRGVRWRTLHDAETAKRANFKAVTLRAFEEAYMLVPGSLDRTLAGGPLEPAAGPAGRPGPPESAVTPELLAAFKGDRTRALIWLAGENEGKDPAVDRADDLTQEIFRVLDNWRLGRRLRGEGTA